MRRWRASGRVFHAASATTIGATGRPLPPLAAAWPRRRRPARSSWPWSGAHLSGMALNHELRSAGALFLRAVDTEACLRLYALPGGPPERPGLVRVGGGHGHAIATEVWALPAEAFGASSPAFRRRSASARCCSPTAPAPRASCARARPSAPPGHLLLRRLARLYRGQEVTPTGIRRLSHANTWLACIPAGARMTLRRGLNPCAMPPQARRRRWSPAPGSRRARAPPWRGARSARRRRRTSRRCRLHPAPARPSRC